MNYLKQLITKNNMKDTKSKVTLNLYGKKIKAKLSCADPELNELIYTYVELLKRHFFDEKDIYEALISHVLFNYKSEDITSNTDSTSTKKSENIVLDYDYLTSKK
jgi:hypothetical protein